MLEGEIRAVAQKLSKGQRHRRIVELAQSRGYLSVSQLADVLGVSTMTLRRDLDELAETGVLERVRGGVMAQVQRVYEPSYILRSKEHVEEKRWIGKKAASLVCEGDLVAIDVGSTLLELAKNLDDMNITVVTHWVPCLQHLYEKKRITTVVLGGVLYGRELSLVGRLTLDALASFHPKKAFLGVSGISLEHGIMTDFNVEEIAVKKELIRQSSEVIVLADHSKIGNLGPMTVCSLRDVDKLITDVGVSEDDLKLLQQASIEVLLAGPDD